MRLKLQPASPIPTYLQIVEQIRHGIAAGHLKADDGLPSVRTLASQQLINPNAVARAYLELERDGLGGHGRPCGRSAGPGNRVDGPVAFFQFPVLASVLRRDRRVGAWGDGSGALLADWLRLHRGGPSVGAWLSGVPKTLARALSAEPHTGVGRCNNGRRFHRGVCRGAGMAFHG